MTTRKPSRVASASIALAAGLLLSAQAMASDLSNKFRIECSGRADSDGSITIVVTPDGGAPIETVTDVIKGTSENRVAQAIVDALTVQLPSEEFHVERDDGEDVLVKRRMGQVRFRLAVTAITVEGVRINVEKE
jgi:hypothetical protein